MQLSWHSNKKKSQKMTLTTFSNIASTKKVSPLTPQEIFEMCTVFVKCVVLQVNCYIKHSRHTYLIVLRQFKNLVRIVHTFCILEKYQIIKKRSSIHEQHPKRLIHLTASRCQCIRLHVMHIQVIRLNKLQSRSFHVPGCGEVVFFRLTTLD